MDFRSLATAAGLVFLLNMVSSNSRATKPDSSDQDAWQKDLLDWRAKHVAELHKPDGWLSLSGLEWLQPGDNSFGGAADNKIHLAGTKVAHLGVLQLDGQTVRLLEPSGGFPPGFLVARAAAKSQVLRTDADNDKNAPHLTIETLNMYVIRRGDRFALRVKDSKSQALLGFHGLKWYAPDPAYRVTAKWIPYNPPKTVGLDTLAGTHYSQPVPGAAEFKLTGETYRLEPVLEDSDPKKLFFILRDTTSASTTYGACRFLYTALPSEGVTKPGDLVLDFNHLENPPCAYTPFATCPLPPPGNRLHIGLPVGEQRYHD
ncbi:MAG TPA: DUF1684 domain-containing protein [Methylomirabilota bacterium]|nr:DUF1684 domain-containing protein [Methylomirabilota bacterium]